MANVFIIAEAGVNHNGDLSIAKRLVEEAAKAGADAVKFQTFAADDLVTPTARAANYQLQNTGREESQYKMLKKLQLSYEKHLKLKAHCAENNIDFLSSAFDAQSAAFLIDNMKLSLVKLGSGELTNAPLLYQIAQRDINLILSTGMASLEEVKKALGVLTMGYKAIQPSAGVMFENVYDPKCLRDRVMLLHCTSDYPADPSDVNLRAMDTLALELNLRVGYSDHTLGSHIAVAAVARGAQVIEKHFTLNREMDGPDHKASLEPQEFAQMVINIRDVERALGDGQKTPRLSEMSTKTVARKSLVAVKNISKGDKLSPLNMATKRPEGGVSPFEYWNLIGTKVARDYQKDDMIESSLDEF